jgi:hypothetical protein
MRSECTENVYRRFGNTASEDGDNMFLRRVVKLPSEIRVCYVPRLTITEATRNVRLNLHPAILFKIETLYKVTEAARAQSHL